MPLEPDNFDFIPCYFNSLTFKWQSGVFWKWNHIIPLVCKNIKIKWNKSVISYAPRGWNLSFPSYPIVGSSFPKFIKHFYGSRILTHQSFPGEPISPFNKLLLILNDLLKLSLLQRLLWSQNRTSHSIFNAFIVLWMDIFTGYIYSQCNNNYHLWNIYQAPVSASSASSTLN